MDQESGGFPLDLKRVMAKKISHWCNHRSFESIAECENEIIARCVHYKAIEKL